MSKFESRLEKLEATVRKWDLSNKVYESFDMENNKARAVTWTQREGRWAGDWIEFASPRAALDWVISQLGRGPAEIYLTDVREMLPDEDRLIFDTFFPSPLGVEVMFNLRAGQDVMAEAIRTWRRSLCGVKHDAWWTGVNERLDNLLKLE